MCLVLRLNYIIFFKKKFVILYSKSCQRKAWVLHKNWCLKFTGDTATTSSNALASNASLDAAVIPGQELLMGDTASVVVGAENVVGVVEAAAAAITAGGGDQMMVDVAEPIQRLMRTGGGDGVDDGRVEGFAVGDGEDEDDESGMRQQRRRIYEDLSEM